MTLKKVIIKAYVVVSVLMLFLVFGIYFVSQYHIKSQRDQNFHTMIATIASSVSNETQALTQWIDALAVNPVVVSTFNFDEKQRKQKLLELEGQTSGLLRLRMLKPGVNQPDDSQSPRLGYADLELIQTAQSENPHPVIVQLKTPDAHIAVARAVYQDEHIVGTLLASFSTDRIKKHVSTLSQQDGTIALFQEQQSLSNSGDSALLEVEPNGTLPIVGTSWEIRYWSSTQINYQELLYVTGALVATLILLALFSMKIFRKLTNQFEEDIKILKQAVSDVAEGVSSNGYELNFSMFSELIKHNRLLNIRDVTNGKNTIEVGLTSEEEEEKKLAERGDALLNDLDQQFEKADAMIGDLENEDFGLGGKPDAGNNDSFEVTQSTAVNIPVSLPLTTGISGDVGKKFNREYVKSLGCALGTELLEAGMTKIVVGSGHSKSTEKAAQDIFSGLLTAGCKLLDLKQVASPVVAFSTQFPKESVGVIVSNSFLPANVCKLKFIYNGGYVSAEFLKKVLKRQKSGSFIEGLGVSGSSDTNSEAEYIGAIVEDIHIHCNMKVAVVSESKSILDLAGNLFKALGCDVVSLAEPGLTNTNESFDLRNPSHLSQLCSSVKSEQADLGIAYDTEGTNLAIVDSSGHIIWADRVMMVLTADVLQTFPGADVLFDNDCISELAKTVTKYSGKLLCHGVDEGVFSHLTTSNMPLAGNINGQFVFSDRWLQFPDALYATARLLEILSAEDETSHEIFSGLPDYLASQPFYSEIGEQVANSLLDKWSRKFTDSGSAVTASVDGFRVDAANIGWVIVRYEKRLSRLVFRFQATTQDGLQKLMKSFKKLVPKDSSLTLPF